jgi:hypothetical protein
MKRFVAVCIFFGCVLAVPGAHNAIAANRAGSSGRPVEKQNEEATIAGQMKESVDVTPAAAALQSPNDILSGGGVTIMSAAEGYAWRVWPGGKIEFSFDSARTWVTQKSGVTTDLTAGSSPSSKVCWVVGKAGAVLLTTDRGSHWKKLASPIKEDLGGVFAEDAKRASVWNTSHSQSFGTNDGGVTWSPNSEK